MSVFNRLALISIALLAGCASAPASLSYRPREGGDAYTVIGENPSPGHLIVTINGEKALEGDVSFWTGAGDISGTWRGKAVDAHCHQATDGWKQWGVCSIVIGGEFAGEMKF